MGFAADLPAKFTKDVLLSTLKQELHLEAGPSNTEITAVFHDDMVVYLTTDKRGAVLPDTTRAEHDAGMATVVRGREHLARAALCGPGPDGRLVLPLCRSTDVRELGPKALSAQTTRTRQVFGAHDAWACTLDRVHDYDHAMRLPAPDTIRNELVFSRANLFPAAAQAAGPPGEVRRGRFVSVAASTNHWPQTFPVLRVLYLSLTRTAAIQLTVAEVPPTEDGPALPQVAAEECFAVLTNGLALARAVVSYSPTAAPPPAKANASTAHMTPMDIARKQAQLERQSWKRK